jgi:hypothetical protein
MRRRRIWSRERRGRAGPVVGDRAYSLLHLRIGYANGNSQYRTRLQHASSCAQQCQILIIRNLNQLVERWIPKAFPPMFVLRGTRLDRAIVYVTKFVGERSNRRCEIRPDRACRDRQKKCSRKDPTDRAASRTGDSTRLSNNCFILPDHGFAAPLAHVELNLTRVPRQPHVTFL